MADTNYLDKRQFSPASMGITVAVNGGILAMLLTLAGGVVSVLPDDGTIIFQPTPPPPPITEVIPKPNTDKPVETLKPVKQYTVPPTQNPPPAGNNDLTAGTGLTPTLPPPTGGTGIEIPAGPLIQPHVPVFIKPIIDPRHKASFQPDYPGTMIRAGLEGVAVVRVLIGTDGRVKEVEAVRADEEDFLKVTRAHALRKWRFKPATQDGIPIESWKEMTVRFEFPD